MQAKDLREGNFLECIINGVRNYGPINIIDLIEMQSKQMRREIYRCTIIKSNVKFRPIPISEFWLKCCHFSKRSDEVFFIVIGTFEFEWIIGEGLFVDGVGINVEYVHQLQNLVHSMTFTELKITYDGK